MSARVISLYIEPKKLKKLQNGNTVQLTHAQLIEALSKEPNFELQMLRKDITALLRTHQSKKGYRLSHKKILGGKINWKSIGRTLKKGLESVVKNPVVREIAKEGAKQGLDMLNQYGQSQGYDIGDLTTLGKRGLEGEDVKNQLLRTAGKKGLKLASDKFDEYQARQTSGSGFRKDFEKGFKKGLVSTLTNPIVQKVALSALTGAGLKKPAKGSPEMKEKMAYLRSLRGKKQKGAALFQAGVRGGALYPSGKKS